MNILTINSVYDKGGAALIAKSIHDYINKGENRSSIYLYGYNHGKKVVDKNAIRLSNLLKVKFNSVYFKYTMKDFFDISLKNKNKISNILKNIDIIHLHNIHGYTFNWYTILGLIPKNIPVVWTLHDNWILTGRCATIRSCKEYTSGCKVCPHKDYYPASIAQNTEIERIFKYKTLKQFDNLHLVIQSKMFKNKLKQNNIDTQVNGKMHIIPNGINSNFFSEKKDFSCLSNFGIDIKAKKTFLFVSEYLSYAKGFDLFLTLAKDNPDLQFIAVGKLPRNIRKKDIGKNVILLGYMKNDVLHNLFKFSDIYLHLSREDNYPTTILEALASRCKVISVDVGCVPEMLSSGEGVVLDFESIREYVKNEKSYDFGKGSVFTYEETAKKYLILYKKVIDNGF